jgi:hypothetical protein
MYEGIQQDYDYHNLCMSDVGAARSSEFAYQLIRSEGSPDNVVQANVRSHVM